MVVTINAVKDDVKIGVVVVLYKPTLEVANRILAYPHNIDYMILIDNSGNDNSSLFKKILSKNIVYKSLGKNTGISHALNDGIKNIMSKVDFIITMDQDSLLTKKIIDVYRSFIIHSSEPSPYALTPKYNTDRHREKPGSGYKYIKLSMQSGALFSKKIFEKIGFFEEDLFIDVVDWEFFLRMSKYGYKLIRCNEAVLKHNPAITNSKKLLFFNLKYGGASPTRYYYQARNLLKVANEYKSLRMYAVLMIKYLKILLLFDNKKVYLAHFKKGLCDAKKV